MSVFSFTAEEDYEDLTCSQRAVAIYDYEGGATLFHFLTDVCYSSLNICEDKSFHLLYHTEADDEISFNPDDIITNIEMIDEGWWKGQCRGQIGLFPAAYVQLMQ